MPPASSPEPAARCVSTSRQRPDHGTYPGKAMGNLPGWSLPSRCLWWRWAAAPLCAGRPNARVPARRTGTVAGRQGMGHTWWSHKKGRDAEGCGPAGGGGGDMAGSALPRRTYRGTRLRGRMAVPHCRRRRHRAVHRASRQGSRRYRMVHHRAGKLSSAPSGDPQMGRRAHHAHRPMIDPAGISPPTWQAGSGRANNRLLVVLGVGGSWREDLSQRRDLRHAH